jgi:hypothetical protein
MYMSYVKYIVYTKAWGPTSNICNRCGVLRGTLLVVQLFEAQRYTPEGHGFDSR